MLKILEKSQYLLAIIIIFLVFLGFCSRKSPKEKNSIISNSNFTTNVDFTKYVSSLKKTSGSDINTDYFFNNDTVAVIVFEPTDCPICLQLLTELNVIYNKKENKFPISGIISTPYVQAVKQMQKKWNIEFPLLHDTTGILKSKVINTEYVPMKPILLLIENGSIKLSSIVGDSEYEYLTLQILNILKKK